MTEDEEEELRKAFQARLARADRNRVRVLSPAQRQIRDLNRIQVDNDRATKAYRNSSNNNNVVTGLSDDIVWRHEQGND